MERQRSRWFFELGWHSGNSSCRRRHVATAGAWRVGRTARSTTLCGLPERELLWSIPGVLKLTYSQAENMEILERTQSWKEEEFDVVLQFMRTILLRRKEQAVLNSKPEILTSAQMAHP